MSLSSASLHAVSDETLYRVAFSGVITGEYDLPTTKARFAKLFRLDERKTDRLFTGKEYILKDKVSEDVAMTFAIRIAEIGCECYIETVPEEIPTGASYDAERRNGERRTHFRRANRPGAGPDRRVLVGRRRDDAPIGAGSRQASN